MVVGGGCSGAGDGPADLAGCTEAVGVIVETPAANGGSGPIYVGSVELETWDSQNEFTEEEIRIVLGAHDGYQRLPISVLCVTSSKSLPSVARTSLGQDKSSMGSS